MPCSSWGRTGIRRNNETANFVFVFVKIGFTSFGGMSMVPIINEEMITHGWMTQEDVANILAIAEMTPGPMGINCATFAGMQVAGVVGGIVAVLGVLTPAFTTTLAVAACYEKFRSTQLMHRILYVIRPVCIGLMLAVIYSLSVTTYFTEGFSPDLVSIGIGAVAFVLIAVFKRNVVVVITVSALLGLAAGMLFH